MNKDYFNIIDFGSSKIRFSVFDNELNEKFLESSPVNLTNDYTNHFNIMNRIIKKSEKKISRHIEDVVLILDTVNALTIDISLNKKLDGNIEISKVYSSLILELNQITNSFYNNYYLAHILLDKCIIDNNIYEELPKTNEIINNIKADFKLICIPKNLINILKNNFSNININVKNFFCSSYVKSSNYLRTLSKDSASFLEIGFNRTSFMFYQKNKLKIIQTIPVGGAHITKDISKIFNITMDEAEKIKKMFNKSETEFSYNSSNNSHLSLNEILNKNISIDLLKKVILYRIQEIIDLIFIKSKIYSKNLKIKNSDLFLIGEGSALFNNNSFHLNDKFEFKKLNYYSETDKQICNAGLVHYLNNFEIPKISSKKPGLFEKFFNFFDK